MKTNFILLASTWLQVWTTFTSAQATEADQALLDKYYPGIENSPDYAGSFEITNTTAVALPGGAHTDFSLSGAGLGVIGIYAVGPGHDAINSAINSCKSTSGATLAECLNDCLQILAVHGLGLYAGGHFGAAWMWSNFKQETPSSSAKRSRIEGRACKTEHFDSPVYFNSHAGMKISCKSGCLPMNYNVASHAADIIKGGALLGPMASKNAGAFQFTVFNKDGGANNGKVYARCNVVAQIVHPDTCLADISGSGCQH